MLRDSQPVLAAVVLATIFTAPGMASAGASGPPNFVPEMMLSYLDPVSGERHECGEGCRRFEVPAGVDLEIRLRVLDVGDEPSGDGVDWDLWFDQPRSPFPPEDFEICFDDQRRLDADCYFGMVDRVDWEWWDTQDADRVCVPDDPSDCLDEIFSVAMDADFDGARGRGVYTFLVWVDRFDSQVEVNDFDNVAGPVRVKVLPRAAAGPVRPVGSAVRVDPEIQAAAPGTTETVTRAAVFAPSSSRPYAVKVIPTSAERSFTVSSRIALAKLEFIPSYPGAVKVEVEQVGVWEKMTVQLRKVSTGELLSEISGKGRLRIEGRIEKVQLVDDRLFEVVVLPGQGTRGLRGTISVTYPDRAVHIRNE